MMCFPFSSCFCRCTFFHVFVFFFFSGCPCRTPQILSCGSKSISCSSFLGVVLVTAPRFLNNWNPIMIWTSTSLAGFSLADGPIPLFFLPLPSSSSPLHAVLATPPLFSSILRFPCPYQL